MTYIIIVNHPGFNFAIKFMESTVFMPGQNMPTNYQIDI